jgi:ATP-dependent Clp protease protease subunit
MSEFEQWIKDNTFTHLLIKERIILLSEGVNSRSAQKFIEQLLAYQVQDPKAPIYIFLNSPGGEVTSGFAIYDMMKFIGNPIHIIVSGLAASIATIILLGTPKKYRYALPNSRFLIHQPLISGQVQGQASDIEITAKEIIKTRELIQKIYQEDTGKSAEKISRDIERDYWMNANEALEYGLVGQIVENSKEVFK